MTLKEKYTVRNKKRLKQYIFMYSILVIFFAAYTTFAKYENLSEGTTNISLANWKIALNGKELTKSNNTLADQIVLKDFNNSEKIGPGQTGYFDIEINPADTEVSFWYKITLDLEKSKLPVDMNITKYSIDEGITENDLIDNSFSGTLLLDNKDKFTKEDIQKIRLYWDWQGEEESGDNAYTVIVNVELKQVL